MAKTEWQLYTSSEQAWTAMLGAVNKARHTIDIEQYIFTYDDIGDRFIRALLAARQRGVRVRLLLDSVGSEGAVFDGFDERPLLEAGIEVIFFNPFHFWKFWKLLRLWTWLLRDHSKIMIIDGHIGYTGGVGIRTDMKMWRDMHLKIIGPVVSAMTEAFELMWESVRAGKRIIGGWPRIVRDSSFQFLMNFPKLHQRHIYYEFLRAIKSAKHYIYLTTPYFVPTMKFSRALKKAVAQGVDVRLIVPAVIDHLTVELASQSYYGIGLKAGIRIFQYGPQMIHSKTAVIDGSWSSVGSANLDNLSFLLNYEGNIFSSDPEFSAEIRKQFDELLVGSKELSLAQWKKRPLLKKFLELLTWPFHRLL